MEIKVPTHSVLRFFFQIIADTISPFYIIFLFLRTSFYPLKDLFGDYGEGMCHFYDYLLVIGAFAGQFHSFFLTAFRYICLFHDDFMLRYNIQPKVRYLIVNLSFLKKVIQNYSCNCITYILYRIWLECFWFPIFSLQLSSLFYYLMDQIHPEL